jgi:hypothetical protein
VPDLTQTAVKGLRHTRAAADAETGVFKTGPLPLSPGRVRNVYEVASLRVMQV